MKTKIVTASVLALLIPLAVFLSWKKAIDIQVTAPETYSVGELVVLDASKSTVKDLSWVIFPETADFKVDGRRAYFSSKTAQTYTVIISGTNGKTVESVVVTLKTSTLTPTPTPAPPNDPFNSKIKSWLPDGYTKAAAYRLSQSFRSVAAISKNSFNDLEAMLLATAYSNRVALGDDLSQWEPFLDKLSKELENDPPISIVTCAEKWVQIANALEIQ